MRKPEQCILKLRSVVIYILDKYPGLWCSIISQMTIIQKIYYGEIIKLNTKQGKMVKRN